MAGRKKTAAASGELFVEDSGQLRIVDKSAEQTAIEKGRVECLGRTFESDAARRAHFAEELRKHLKDPEFRKREGFPQASDDAILAMSDPPYYTACPNPFLADFVRCFGQPYDPVDPYAREPFSLDTAGGKNDDIYNSHAYHTKSPWQVIAAFIRHYTSDGAVVLDPFAGSGMCGVAVNSVGKRTGVLVDLSPAATQIAYGNNSPRMLSKTRVRAQEILTHLESEYGWLYETTHNGWNASIRDHRSVKRSSSATSSGIVQFTLWSDVLSCPHCDTAYCFWDTAIDFKNGALREKYPCPSCAATISKDESARVTEKYLDPILGAVCMRQRQDPVLINYKVGSKRFEKDLDDSDRSLLRKAELAKPNPIPPSEKMMFRDPPWGQMYRAGYHTGMTHTHHFYWWRSLIVLAKAAELTKHDKDLRFWFTATVPWCTRENRLHVGNYFGKKGGVITTYRGAIYIASLGVEVNPIERLRHRLDSALVETGVSSHSVFVSTQSSSNLQGIASDSIDFVFTDPPFGENLMYSELNFLWEAWFSVWTNQREEAIVSDFDRKDVRSYSDSIRGVFREVQRVLKPGRWAVVQFHNSESAIWVAIQNALNEAGLVVADVRVMDKGKGSFKQVVAAGSVRQDLVIAAYKPGGEFEAKFETSKGTSQGAWEFVQAHLRHLPLFVEPQGKAEVIPERQAYLLFDRMVAFHVQRRASVPLGASEFYSGLKERFPERDGMYFLPEQVGEYERRRAKHTEIAQEALLVTDEKSAIQWLRRTLERKPSRYQELHPLFTKELHKAQHERTVELKDLLKENFLEYEGTGEVPDRIYAYFKANYPELRKLAKDDPAVVAKARERWFVPDMSKQLERDKVREKALLKEFEEYKASKQARLKEFRTEAIRAGFKAAWNNKDYKTIVEVAKKLPETVVQEDAFLVQFVDNATTLLEG